MPKDIDNTDLESLCNDFRKELLYTLYKSQSGHPGSSLSVCEILTALYYNVLNMDPANPHWEQRDRLILSKGHAAPMLYVIMANRGFFPKSELNHLRKLDHMLQGHPSTEHVPGVDYTAGPLGLGLSFGVGVAAGAKLLNKSYHSYVILGDGELQEGCIWEGMMSASKLKLNNLTTIVDNNGVQLDGLNDEIMPLGSIYDKFSSFGANVIEVDGHNIEELTSAMEEAKSYKEGHTVILAKTIKGKGVSFMEGKSFWHSAKISKETYQQAVKELGGAL